LVKEGDGWKSAYYNEVVIKEPKPELTSMRTQPAGGSEKPAANTAKPAAPPKVENTNKAGTYANANAASLPKAGRHARAVEQERLGGMEEQDAAALESLLAANFTYLGRDGPRTRPLRSRCGPSITDTIKSWSVTTLRQTSLNPTVALLTFKGNASGSCDGTPLSNSGTDLMIKEGDNMENPSSI
jgi:hypothetical protein